MDFSSVRTKTAIKVIELASKGLLNTICDFSPLQNLVLYGEEWAVEIWAGHY